MSITKRTRFEVLRRDNHACRYCGATAPETKLTIDHVIPVSLGGSDSSSNLVAACRDCNAGKSSTSPDEHLVEYVKQKALQLRETYLAAFTKDLASIQEWHDYRDWTNDLLVEAGFKNYPQGWKATIRNWFHMGVPFEVIEDSFEIAAEKPTLKTEQAVWKYFCGIVWKKLNGITEIITSDDDVSFCAMCGEKAKVTTITRWNGKESSGCYECLAPDIYESGLHAGWELATSQAENRKAVAFE